jgi:DNA-binding NarL/FixJ family response regulator
MAEKSIDNDVKRILIVDDHPLICKGLTQMINNEKDIMVCGDANDINSAMKKIADQSPHLVIVDISLKSSSGIDLIKAIKTRYPELLSLVYSMHDESVFAERVLKAGAKGYVMKDQPAEILLNAIRKVLTGNVYFSDTIITKLLGRYNNIGGGDIELPINSLTNRELEIFQLIGQELKSKQIADKLNISIKTVEAHREHLRRKLNIHNSTDLNKYAKEWLQSISDNN